MSAYYVRTLESFWDYVRRTDRKNMFDKLAPGEKHEIYLKWKWGSSASDMNQEYESTRKSQLHGLVVDAIPDPRERQYWANAVKLEEVSRGILEKIGYLKPRLRPGITQDPEVKKAVEEVNGVVVG